jgi:hypothetical protein
MTCRIGFGRWERRFGWERRRNEVKRRRKKNDDSAESAEIRGVTKEKSGKDLEQRHRGRSTVDTETSGLIMRPFFKPGRAEQSGTVTGWLSK